MVSVRVSTHAQLGLIPGNSRKISFPKVPGNFWGFLCTEKRKLRIFTQFSPTFLDFSFAFKSNFIVKKDNIQVKNHCNSSKNCIFSQKRMFSNIYIVIPGTVVKILGIPFPGMEIFREFTNPIKYQICINYQISNL